MRGVQTISREVSATEVWRMTPQRLHASPWGSSNCSWEVARAYLLGALGDATINRLHRTTRFSQKERAWLEQLQQLLAMRGFRSWIYREGKDRHLYVLETSAQWLKDDRRSTHFETDDEIAAYVRGYFDAEGGIPWRMDAPLYVQFVQKNAESLTRVKDMLERLEIRCGVLHNPSRRVDPDYWRFFVRRSSHQQFIAVIGSWHPRKRLLLQQRVKI